MRPPWILVMAFAGLLPACGPSVNGSDAGTDAGTDAAPPASFGGFVYEYGTAPTAPISGATMTVLDGAPPMMTVTDPAGTYTLMATAGTTVWVRGVATGEASQQKAITVPGSGGVLDFALVPDTGIAAVSAALGIMLDPM